MVNNRKPSAKWIANYDEQQKLHKLSLKTALFTYGLSWC